MSFDLERTFEILERTPATLTALLTGLSEARVVAKQYRDEVGPWKAYLRVLE